MKNFHQNGQTINVVAPTGGITGGGVAVVTQGPDGRIAVAVEAITAGEEGTCYAEGVFELPAVTGTAFDQGDVLYWSGSALTKTATGNDRAGVAWADKGSSAALALVKINA